MSIANLECPACECRFQVGLDDVARHQEDVGDEERAVVCPDCGIRIKLPASDRQVNAATHGEDRSGPTDGGAVAQQDTARRLPTSPPQRASTSASTATSPMRRTGAFTAVPVPHRLRERRITPPQPSEATNLAAKPADVHHLGARRANLHRLGPPKVARPSAPDLERVTAASVVRSADEPTSHARQDVSLSPRATSPAAKAAGPLPSASQLARQRSGRKLGILLVTAGGSLVALLAVALILTQIVWRGTPAQPDAGKEAGMLEAGVADREDLETPTPEATSAGVVVDPMELAEVWSRSHGYLVVLTVERQGVTNDVAGVVVDNRGWVATSLPAVAGADRVQLRRASTTSDDLADVEATLIESRGFIAADPRNHIALLAFSPIELTIDRDPVLSIDEFPATRSTLFAGGVPSRNHSWLVGCQVEEKRETKPQAISQLANVDLQDTSLDRGGNALASNPEMLTSMVLTLPVDPRFAGGPLLRSDGAIAGLLVVPPQEEANMWAVSVTHVRRLKEFSRDVPIPFDSSELAVFRSSLDKPRLARNDGGANGALAEPAMNLRPEPGTLASRDHLTELRDRCRDADWSPSDPDEYRVFQDLGEYLTAAEEVAVDESIDEGLRLLLDQTASEIRDELSRTAWPDDATMQRVNELAIDSLSGSNNGFYGYARIVLPPGLAPEIKGAGSVVMQLIGHEQQIILPVTRAFEQLRADSEWLILGTKQGGRTVVVNGDDGTPNSVALIYAIHLGARPELIAGESEE